MIPDSLTIDSVPAADVERATPAMARRAFTSWSGALLLIVAVSILRFAYLVWLCPYQLVGDEAYYWCQSRHLDLCYDEKGPALPWLIAASCKAFGDHEWAVRLPMVVSFALAAWGIGRLAMSVSRGDERVGFLAVTCFCLLPAFQANAQICTQDGPLIAIWVALTAMFLRLFRRWSAGKSTWIEWMLGWFVLGVGMLFKQSTLLFLASVVLFWIAFRPRLRVRPALLFQQLAGLAVFGLVISPMLIWNQRHGWPMVAHTLGHLGAGGDQAGKVNHGNAAVWVATTVGGVVGAFGPGFIILAVWASRTFWRERSINNNRSNSDQTDMDRQWLAYAAWPSLAFFVLLSLWKPVIASWPLPSLVPLVPLVALLAIEELPKYRDAITAWRARKAHMSQPTYAASGLRKPETQFHRWWTVMVCYGIGGWILISFPTLLGHLPLAGRPLQRSLLSRLTGNREAAARLQQVIDRVHTPDGRPPIVVTTHYMRAALYTFYLPGHPSVRTAGNFVGHRPSTFDQWSDTTLDDPAIRGRTLLLVGDGAIPWAQGLKFDHLETVVPGEVYLAPGYAGAREAASDEIHRGGDAD